MIVELFGGPGGWAEGLRMLGRTAVALELDRAACATRAAAGHATIRTDVAVYPTEPFCDKIEGLIASPPCQDFSLAGKQMGLRGDRGALMWQVLRWAKALQPRWIACEQVPPVLPIWRSYARQLEELGYCTWTGLLNAADYGVPQTRERAFLMASLLQWPVHPPAPTHAKAPAPGADLFGTPPLLPWVSMAEALGWEPGGAVGFPRRDDVGGGPDGYRARDMRSTSLPAQAVTEKARSWALNPGLTAAQPNRRLYALDEPAPTVAFGHDAANWAWERPAFTVLGTGVRDLQRPPGDHRAEKVPTGSVRITMPEAATLQSFRTDYPWQGSRSKQFEQVGNAVPPLLAKAVLAQLLK